jgi:integrase
LGAADDANQGPPSGAMSYAEAQNEAGNWFGEKDRERRSGYAGSYTVENAIEDYLAWLGKHRKAVDRAESSARAHIIPALGEIEVTRITRTDIEHWHEKLAETPARLRTRREQPQKFKDASDDPDAVRRRRSTANRILTILRAALNRAGDRAGGNDAWRRVEPFRAVDAARVEFLTDAESRRLVNAAKEPFRSLLAGALLTGARYGELTAMQAADFDERSGTVQIRQSKSGKSRHVTLSDEGVIFFKQRCVGKHGSDLIFAKPAGVAWGPSDQRRPMLEACAAAKIKTSISFHGLRHTYASRLVNQGVPLVVIAAQLGHTDTRMVEKHYGHLAPSYVSETVRQAFGSIGIVAPSNVERLVSKKERARAR